MRFENKDLEVYVNKLSNEVLNYLRKDLSNFKVTFKKNSNKAPKSIKGDYDLSIHGNKIVLVDKNEGATVEAKCHPDDDFDIGVGIKEAFKKMNEKREEIRKAKEEEEKKIKVGDWVEVVNNGASCSQLDDFFEKNNVLQYAARFRYGVSPFIGTKGKVLFIGNNTHGEKNVVVMEVPEEKYCGSSEFSDLNCYNGLYLICLNGLRKVAKPRV